MFLGEHLRSEGVLAATAHTDPGRREGLWGPGRFLLLATQVEVSPPRPRDPPPASQEIK
jgi:hypothetical protein